MSNTPVYIYPGSGFDLGVDCAKPFSVLSIAIRETGDSEILKLVED
jgi:ribosomal protein L30E